MFFVAISVNSKAYGVTNDIINIKYQTHVQNIGWQNPVLNGALAGTSGQSLRTEGIMISLENAPATVHVKYQAHIQNIGWQDWTLDGQLAGTTGKSLRVEAVKIVLEGLPIGYHVVYQAHVQNIGWQDWVQDGQIAGTSGKSLRVEALRIKIVAQDVSIKYQSKMEHSALGPLALDGEVSGAAGQSLKLTGINIQMQNVPSDFKVKYQVHMQNVGWGDWAYDGKTAGMPNEEVRIEGLRVMLEGNTSNYHVQYQAYVEGIGWQPPVYDGAIAGIVSKSLRIEAVKIKVVKIDPANINSVKKNIKIAIDKGHNNSFDIGASGYRQEDDLTREVGIKVISKLQSLGYIVIDCTPSSASSLVSSLGQRVQVSNSNEVGIFASIHFNAFNGFAHGSEVYYHTSAEKPLAQNVLNKLLTLGYFNRGIKDGSSLYVLRYANSPAILIECSFVDSLEDMNKYNAENISNAIVSGLALN